MSVSKRFKKKLKDFRQGMTAWRVHSYPIRDENYHEWGKDQEELDRRHGKGNGTCFHTGSTWIFIVCDRICKSPEKTIWGWSDWKKGNGKRSLHRGKSLQSLWGSDGNRFFAKQHQAQAFMHEIIEGTPEREEMLKQIKSCIQPGHLYSVSGNLDQLKKNGLDTEHIWVPHERQPNSVKTLLPFEQAQALYTKLKDLGLVAFKNWL